MRAREGSNTKSEFAISDGNTVSFSLSHRSYSLKGLSFSSLLLFLGTVGDHAASMTWGSLIVLLGVRPPVLCLDWWPQGRVWFQTFFLFLNSPSCSQDMPSSVLLFAKVYRTFWPPEGPTRKAAPAHPGSTLLAVLWYCALPCQRGLDTGLLLGLLPCPASPEENATSPPPLVTLDSLSSGCFYYSSLEDPC